MRGTYEFGSTFTKTTIVLGGVGVLSLVGIYLIRTAVNDTYAEGILDDVWMFADQRKTEMDLHTSGEENTGYSPDIRVGRKGYVFTIRTDSTPDLIKIETGKRVVSSGVCDTLKAKVMGSQWLGTFSKIMVIDWMGNEKTDILIHSCPSDDIPGLRFYVRFEDNTPPAPVPESVEEVVVDAEEESQSEATSISTEISSGFGDEKPAPRVSVPAPSYSKTQKSCPPGTSLGGSGGAAISGCRCNGANESWNGKACELKSCPEGSSRNASNKGDETNVPGCHCESERPRWLGGRCVSKCKGNRVFDIDSGECICPGHLFSKTGAPDTCVECNSASDCFMGYKCVGNRCVEDSVSVDDCRWGVCQTCDENGVRRNMRDYQECITGGVSGRCNNNGTCYPVQGSSKRCPVGKGCSAGEFCNYGGTLNSTKKQKGQFGQTPNVCQIVDAQEFTYQGVTYYYNSKQDLLSWCRAANNEPNCMWGYLAKPGAESWCASLGKRLLTKNEMSNVWSVLKEQLPQTYTGYAYWVQEGAWIENKEGKRSFGKGHPDGYGGKGGVVCR